MKQSHHICLDPGHGPGSANRSPDGRYEEQEFAMDLAERMKLLLEARGQRVTMTRTKEGYPSLSARCQVSNSHKDIALFVSLHSNAAGGGGWQSAAGQLIFTSEAGDEAARNQAARHILAAWEAAGFHQGKTPLRHQNFTVLTDTRAPAVLLEHGFHTNRGEVEALKDPKHRQALAKANVAGILAYLGLSKQANPHRARVKARFGLSEETMDYLEVYRFGADLLAKLAERG